MDTRMNSYANDRSDERFSDVDSSELHEIKSRESLRKFQRHNRIRKGFGKLVQILIFLIIIIIFIAVCFAKVFVIRNVEVVGTDRYAGDELLGLIGASKGDSLYSIRGDSVASLPSKLSFVRSAKITRKLPQTLVITLMEDEASYYCELYGEYFLLSDNLRVLDRVYSEEDVSGRGLIRLELPRVDRAVVGEIIVFDNESDIKYVTAYLSALAASRVYDITDAFDLRDKYDLAMICDSIYLVELSDGEELSTKLSTLAQVLSHEALQGKGKARIDLSEPSRASAIFDIKGDVKFENIP